MEKIKLYGKNNVKLLIGLTLILILTGIKLYFYYGYPDFGSDENGYMRMAKLLRFFNLDFSPLYIFVTSIAWFFTKNTMYAHYINYLFWVGVFAFSIFQFFHPKKPLDYIFTTLLVIYFLLSNGILVRERHVTLPIVGLAILYFNEIYLTDSFLGLKDRAYKILALSLTMYLIRPEFLVLFTFSLILLLYNLIINIKFNNWRFSKELFFKSFPLILSTIILVFIVYLKLNNSDKSRSIIAFIQHYTVYKYEILNLVGNPWLDETLFHSTFGDAKSITQAMQNNPNEFFTFILRNAKLFRIGLLDYIVSEIYTSISVYSKIVGYKACLYLSLFLGALTFFYFFKITLSNRKFLFLIIYTIYNVLALLGNILIFPNLHYLVYFAPTIIFPLIVVIKNININNQFKVAVKIILILLFIITVPVFYLKSEITEDLQLRRFINKMNCEDKSFISDGFGEGASFMFNGDFIQIKESYNPFDKIEILSERTLLLTASNPIDLKAKLSSNVEAKPLFIQKNAKSDTSFIIYILNK